MRAGGHRHGVRLRLYHAVLHRLQVCAGPQGRRGVHHGPRHQRHRGRGPRTRVHCPAGARDKRCSNLRVLAWPHERLAGRSGSSDRRPLRHGRRDDGDAEHGRVRFDDGRVRAHRGQRRRNRGNEPAARARARGYRPSRRGGQHDQGNDEGLRDRLGRARLFPALQRLHGRVQRLLGRAVHQRRHRRSRGLRRRAPRRHAGVSVLEHGVHGGGAQRAGGGQRGPSPVRRAPGHHVVPGKARLRSVCEHRREVGLAGDGAAGRHGGGRAHRRRRGVQIARRRLAAATARRARRRWHAHVRDRHGDPHGSLSEYGRRGVGQRQEVHRAGGARGQEQRGAQGQRHGRHGGRPLQRHGGAVPPRAHQTPVHGHSSDVPAVPLSELT
mmetsp:Transcript_1537/g.6078  ORF Transcript_1537/g.6078 Transcript_1537/m.6078 type:complete len:382 (+) Transcript_1537:455-1600(+)